MNLDLRKKIIFVALALIALMVSLVIYSYIYRNSAENRSREAIESSEDDFQKYISDSLLKKLNDQQESLGVNKEYYEQAVSEYEVTKNVKSVKIESKSDTKTTSLLEVATITKNKRSGFSFESLSQYRTWLTKEDGVWKIDSYELISSETVD
jgi:hypothetical protein